MKILVRISIALLALAAWCMPFAKAQSLSDQVTQKMGMYVFPANGQTEEQLDKDQSDCYTWAVQQSGVDPLNPPKVEATPVPEGPTGAAIGGAAKGAAVGAAIGGVTGDAGEGAAVGAIAGAAAGRRAGKQAQAQAQASSSQAASQQEAELMNSFKKAYSVCLEGKGYTVK